MKYSLTLIILFITVFIAAQAQVSQIGHDLTVFSEDGKKFTLIINGAKANETPASNVVIKDIHNNTVKAKIEFEDTTIPAIERKYLNIRSAGNPTGGPETVVYEIRKKKDEYVLRFASAAPKKIQQAPSQVIIIEQAPQAAPQPGIQINLPNGNVNVPAR